MHCNYKVVINYWNTKTHLILSLILHEFQQQSISGTVWSRSGSASGSTERSVHLDAWHSLYSPGLLWGFPSLPVIPSKFAFLYPAFPVSCKLFWPVHFYSTVGCSLDCEFCAYLKPSVPGWHTMLTFPVLSEGPSLRVKTLYLVAPAPPRLPTMTQCDGLTFYGSTFFMPFC